MSDNTPADITDWQRRFIAGPKVYGVSVLGEIGNYYESREAAEIEVDWLHKHGPLKAMVVTLCVHTLELSRERWT